jgi:hypothetical protein
MVDEVMDIDGCVGEQDSVGMMSDDGRSREARARGKRRALPEVPQDIPAPVSRLSQIGDGIAR